MKTTYDRDVGRRWTILTEDIHRGLRYKIETKIDIPPGLDEEPILNEVREDNERVLSDFLEGL